MLRLILSTVGRVIDDRRGATFMEYGLLIALISVAGLAAISLLSTSIQTTFTRISTGV